MLAFYADSLIIPTFESLQIDVNNLNTSIEAFALSQTSENLIAIQQKYKASALSWQKASPFDFTYSEDENGILLSDNVNIFPTSVSKIETAIEAGNNTFTFSNRDARGFQALDYLLFRLDDNNTVLLGSFSDAKRMAYLKAVSVELKKNIDKATTNWKQNRANFIQNDGTAVGSSTSELYNSFLSNFEELKNFKLRLPLGKNAGQTQTEIAQLECYYSGYSLEMLKANMNAAENTWYGRKQNSISFKGFHTYLSNISGGESLVNQTIAQLKAMNTNMNNIPSGRLSSTITSNFTMVEQAYNEISKLTRYWKSDMSSLLGIAITYSSGDGD
ncbi:MAG: imelysin family protein [Cytophagales bacterium]